MCIRAGFVVLLLVSAISCASGETPVVNVARLPNSNIPYLSSSGITERGNLVIRDSAQWALTWSLLNSHRRPSPPLPDIDFDRSMVVVAAAGTRSSGGYSIEIVATQLVAGKLRVTVKETQPGARCIVTDNITAPVDVAILPRFDGAVEFDQQLLTGSCE